MKFLKACWDAVGSEFGSRHQQYEMFYAGARFVTAGHSFRTYDWNGATAHGGKPAGVVFARVTSKSGVKH